ncbi:helix-turn-helix domain-containing protein, partial [Pseudomonas wayambapalatensis]|uniref:helix-turn-helix domain-containing protein n=1 Tax=Pseudomonas wayambapalatensis TaxID=485895 RepID=UPI003CF0F785
LPANECNSPIFFCHFGSLRGQPRSHRSGVTPESSVGVDVLQGAERQALLDVLEAKYWHMTRVAEHLGISRNTLYRKLRKHGIARAG